MHVCCVHARVLPQCVQECVFMAVVYLCVVVVVVGGGGYGAY